MEKLADQALLAKIAVEDNDLSVRRAAVEKLSDRTALAKVAVEDKDWVVQLAAVKKLNDQTVLTKAAVEVKDSAVRKVAVEKLNDQTVLAKVAVEDKVASVREVAAEKLSDQTVLAMVAVEDKVASVRLAAIWKLTNHSLLEKLAAEGKLLDVTLAEVAKTTDSPVVRALFQQAPEAAIRQAAAQRIVDDRALAARLPAESSAAVRAAIVATLRGKEALRAVATTDYWQEDRESAWLRLRGLGDPASDVEAAHNGLMAQVRAVASISESDKLVKLALDGQFDVLRSAAAESLHDPEALEKVARLSETRAVLKIILAKIDDKAMLDRISSTAADPAMRLATARKAKKVSWSEIFHPASAGAASPKRLGDALAAVALFPNVQFDAETSVQSTALDFIRQGNESRIPEMVDLLEAYGDMALAEDYLNCGQPDLSEAATTWANKRGYVVSQGFGSHRASWGSSR